MSTFELHAWVDESMHGAGGDRAQGIYILAAVIADPAACDPVRARLRALVPKSEVRLHWNRESGKLRMEIAKALSECDLAHLVVVGANYDQSHQERARRQCMERLFSELEQHGVTRVVLESRTPSLNKRDERMFDALRGKQMMTGLRADFGLPSSEPMLWVPDAVAGVIGADLRHAQPEPRAALGHGVDVIDIVIS